MMASRIACFTLLPNQQNELHPQSIDSGPCPNLITSLVVGLSNLAQFLDSRIPLVTFISMRKLDEAIEMGLTPICSSMYSITGQRRFGYS